MFSIVDVPVDVDREDEQVGSKAKFWYQRDGLRHMFKLGTLNTGDPWGEKVAEQIAATVSIPHAKVELATCAAPDLAHPSGIVSPTFLSNKSDSLILGNEMLFAQNRAYPHDQGGRLSAHTLAAVFDVLENNNVLPPLGWGGASMRSGAEVFVGYLMLDAVIGNTDRHHQNWGVVKVWKGALHLAPTFDHASSLGTKLRDEERIGRLNTKDHGYSVLAYVQKCRSAIYREPGDRRPMKVQEVVALAQERYPDAVNAWREQFRVLNVERIRDIIAQIPNGWASEAERNFAAAVITCNLGLLFGGMEVES